MNEGQNNLTNTCKVSLSLLLHTEVHSMTDGDLYVTIQGSMNSCWRLDLIAPHTHWPVGGSIQEVLPLSPLTSTSKI